MNSIFELWANKIPNYASIYKAPLFEKITNFGGGSEENKLYAAKSFSSGYELYIYAFFLGLYSNRYSPLEGIPKQNFSVPIKDWGRKTNRLGREDFTDLQLYLFYACFVRTDIDWLEVDKGNIPVQTAISELIKTLEAYTNGGFEIIKDQIDNHPSIYRLDPNKFLELMFKVIDSHQ